MPRSIQFGSSTCLLPMQKVCRYGASTGLLHGSADTDGFLLFTHRPPAWSLTSANGGLIPSSGPAAFAATRSGRHPLAPPITIEVNDGRVRAMDHAPPGGLWHVSTPHRAPAQTMSTTPREHLRNGLGTAIVRPTAKAGISFFGKRGALGVSILFLLRINFEAENELSPGVGRLRWNGEFRIAIGQIGQTLTQCVETDIENWRIAIWSMSAPSPFS